jgi:hypothetical protein
VTGLVSLPIWAYIIVCGMMWLGGYRIGSEHRRRRQRDVARQLDRL